MFKVSLTFKFKACFNEVMDANSIIDQLGGTNAAAALCDVTAQAVSQWRTDGIPHARLMYLKLARPDIFAPVGADATPSQPVSQPLKEIAHHG